MNQLSKGLNRCCKCAGLVLAMLFAGISVAGASVITVNNEATFNGMGTIAFDSHFTDFGIVTQFPGTPFTRGDVTYNSVQNYAFCCGAFTTTETLIGNNFWTPVLGDIARGPQYNMFGFDIGTYGPSPITITVFTNSGSFVYPSLTIANSAAGLLEFRGFVASGEYFTGFNITADNGCCERWKDGWINNLPGITNVELGNTGTAPIPEPASIALLGLGLAGLGFSRRKKA